MHNVLPVPVDEYMCDFVITGKYNILRGASGIGKTHFSKILNNMRLGVVVKSVVVIAPRDIYSLADAVNNMHGACIVVDELVGAVSDHEMMTQIISSDNYYIFVTREDIAEDIATVPYGVKNVFTLEGGPRHFRMRPMYYKMSYHKKQKYSVLLCEDSVSGYEIIKDQFGSKYNVISAGGKDNIAHIVRDCMLNKNVLILADLCGLNGAITAVLRVVLSHSNIGLYDSPSFEYELLSHPLIDRTDLRDLSDEDIMKYASEEAYYTQMVADVLYQTYGLTYDKSINAAVTFLKTGHVNNAHFHLNKNFAPGKWLYPDIPR